jgi:PRC-barrel domain
MQGTSASTTPKHESHRLIASDKVEGTKVRRPNGETVGEIMRLMIDKRTGQVAYAVMSFGGFLGIGEDYYPLPWSRLTYNERLGGYEVNINEAELKNAPKYSKQQSWDWNDQRMNELNSYYNTRTGAL